MSVRLSDLPDCAGHACFNGRDETELASPSRLSTFMPPPDLPSPHRASRCAAPDPATAAATPSPHPMARASGIGFDFVPRSPLELSPDAREREQRPLH
jgi:hypothetical protein